LVKVWILPLPDTARLRYLGIKKTYETVYNG
jgi:hypothetical protein